VTSIGDANFGNVIGLTGEPRKVQLWARLMF
jgi:sugar diacid utilization regulator